MFISSVYSISTKPNQINRTILRGSSKQHRNKRLKRGKSDDWNGNGAKWEWCYVFPRFPFAWPFRLGFHWLTRQYNLTVLFAVSNVNPRGLHLWTRHVFCLFASCNNPSCGVFVLSLSHILSLHYVDGWFFAISTTLQV